MLPKRHTYLPYGENWGSMAPPSQSIRAAYEPDQDTAESAIRYIRRIATDADLIIEILGLTKYERETT